MWAEALIVIIVVIILWLVWVIINFRRWKRDLLLTLETNGTTIKTAVGPVEYAFIGDGPVIVSVHGALGGYDQGLYAIKEYVNLGFSILSLSRPGYLQTPLSTGKSFEAQADAIAALLDALNIQKVAIIGTSAGGPAALHFASKYPDRIWALCLICAVSQQYLPEESRGITVLKRVLGSQTSLDFSAWLFDLLTRYRPSYSLKQMFAENADLDSKEIRNSVEYVMSNPSQVEWYKGFVRTACPLSPRKIGHDNDFEQLEHVNIPEIDRILAPTFIIHGTIDRVVPISHAEFTADSISNSEFYRLEDIGHIVWFGPHVDQMNHDMSKFFKKHIP
ncbi:MAG: alpha/beta fold hydrolase [Candidatus Thorarchaeota archaeon]